MNHVASVGAPAGDGILVVDDIVKRYGVAVTRTAGGEIEHTLLTTLVDKHGKMRVQYLGFRFDPEEFRQDLMELLQEP